MADNPEQSDPGADEHVHNVLFIMCDQLRWDAISCSGHGLIDTPNIDRLAGRGVRFDRAFVQGAVCGSSRMSYYTGRYVQSHGTRWNQVPLQVNQRTLGDHLKPIGVRSVLVGKTHMSGDYGGMKRLGLEPGAPEWIFASECGFESEERHDGLYPDIPDFVDLPYNRFLRANGFEGDNPWHTAANSVIDGEGKWTSGWVLRSAPYPTLVPDELSETAFMTNRAIEFMQAAGDDRWCLHLSYIKPHWPYVAADPYHQMYADLDMGPPNRSDEELVDPHPVLGAFQRGRVGQAFSRPEARSQVYPTYLGLVKQIDDHLGRLFDEMGRMGRLDDTMIVFCSDHGDYMGDHWMGEKDWLHEEVVRTPMIVVDPRRAADGSRGSVSSELVEAIDLVPTFIESLGGDLTASKQWVLAEFHVMPQCLKLTLGFSRWQTTCQTLPAAAGCARPCCALTGSSTSSVRSGRICCTTSTRTRANCTTVLPIPGLPRCEPTCTSSCSSGFGTANTIRATQTVSSIDARAPVVPQNVGSRSAIGTRPKSTRE